MTQKELKQMTETLNERYSIYKKFGERNEDWLYYAGMLSLVERLGFHWARKENGTHRVYKGGN